MSRSVITDEEIRRVLISARHIRDPRAYPMVMLMLSESIDLLTVRWLRWSDIDASRHTLLIRLRRSQPGEARPISTELLKLLLDIGIEGPNLLIFRRRRNDSKPLRGLLQQVFYEARLSNRITTDLVRWSLSQSLQVRRATAIGPQTYL